MIHNDLPFNPVGLARRSGRVDVNVTSPQFVTAHEEKERVV